MRPSMYAAQLEPHGGLTGTHTTPPPATNTGAFNIAHPCTHPASRLASLSPRLTPPLRLVHAAASTQDDLNAIMSQTKREPRQPAPRYGDAKPAAGGWRGAAQQDLDYAPSYVPRG